jgi:hypothetical protein
MKPAEIVGALARHGAKIAVDGERVRLVFKPGEAPPEHLIRAAREHKGELRDIATRPAVLVRAGEPTPGKRSPEPPGLEQIGPWKMLIQLWGGTISEATELVESLRDAAGAPGTSRREHIGELFTKMQGQHCWNGRRKIEWLQYVADEMRRCGL